ncbi:MAG: hypothetical protein ABIG61_12995 [Planctomycetota bacterium]
MHFIIRHFGSNAKYNGKDTYKAVERIFYEQCEVHEDKVSIKKKTGGNVMQNPSMQMPRMMATKAPATRYSCPKPAMVITMCSSLPLLLPRQR